MTPETPNPREALEARLTALLLGELSGAEAASLLHAIENDAALARLHDELRLTIKLVREVSTTPAAEAAAVPEPEPLRMSEDKRQKLLAQFKTVKPREFVEPKKNRRIRMTVLELAAMVAILAILAGLFLPTLSRAKYKSKTMVAYEDSSDAKMAGKTDTNEPYSLNVVGYVNVQATNGINLVANPLDTDGEKSKPNKPEGVDWSGTLAHQEVAFGNGSGYFSPPSPGRANIVLPSSGGSGGGGAGGGQASGVGSFEVQGWTGNYSTYGAAIAAGGAGALPSAQSEFINKVDPSGSDGWQLRMWNETPPNQTTVAGGTGGGGGVGGGGRGFGMNAAMGREDLSRSAANPSLPADSMALGVEPKDTQLAIDPTTNLPIPAENPPLDESKVLKWGSIDGPAKPPIVFADGTSLAQMQNQNVGALSPQDSQFFYRLAENPASGVERKPSNDSWAYKETPPPALAPSTTSQPESRFGGGTGLSLDMLGHRPEGVTHVSGPVETAHSANVEGKPVSGTMDVGINGLITDANGRGAHVAGTVLDGANLPATTQPQGPEGMQLSLASSPATRTPAVSGGLPQAPAKIPAPLSAPSGPALAGGRAEKPTPVPGDYPGLQVTESFNYFPASGANPAANGKVPAQEQPPELVQQPGAGIQAKFAEINANDSKALGFNWTSGDFEIGGKKSVASGGTQTSLTPAPKSANPGVIVARDQGLASPANATTSPASPDGVLAGPSLLHNPADAPTIGTLTGIMTEPQFRVIRRGDSQRDGVDLNRGELLTVPPEQMIASGGTQPGPGSAQVAVDPDGRRAFLTDLEKTPTLGDLPTAGRLFRSEGKQSAEGQKAQIVALDLKNADPQEVQQKLKDIFPEKAAAATASAPATPQFSDRLTSIVQNAAKADDTKKSTAAIQEGLMPQAAEARKKYHFEQADDLYKQALAADPGNQNTLQASADNKMLLDAQSGSIPKAEMLAKLPAVSHESVNVATLVQDGKLLFESGKIDEAEAKLNSAVQADPSSVPAQYYLRLAKEKQVADATRRSELESADALLQVEKSWDVEQRNGQSVPRPNWFNRTNGVYSSKGRQQIMSKLDTIRLDQVQFDNVPLPQAISNLSMLVKERDPDKAGVNLMLDKLAVSAANKNLSSATVKIDPPLVNVRLADVLDAITKTTDEPIKYSILDNGVSFSANEPPPKEIETRTFKIDPDTFRKGLESVSSFNFGDNLSATHGIGGGGTTTTTIPKVNVSGPGPGGVGGGGIGGGGGINGQGGGRFVTGRTNSADEMNTLVRQFFIVAGLDFNTNTSPGKTFVYNERTGTLTVRSTSQDLDMVGAAVETLSQTPPKTTISAKFVEVTDAAPQSIQPGMTLEPMNVMHYNSIKVENEALLAKKEALLDKLKSLSPEALRQTIPTTVPDAVLTALLQNSATAQARLTSLQQAGAQDASEIQSARELTARLDEKINERVQGIIKGLEIDVQAGKAIVANVDKKLEEAKERAPYKPATPALTPQSEVTAAENAFSTFSLNVSDVAFKLAGASLEKGVMPDAGNVRAEEFINAFDYRDPEPAPGAPLAFAWERVRYPFAQNRDLLRFAVKTAAAGRQPGRPLNIVLLLDNSGSMERADRVAIIRQALRVLATKLEPQDVLSVVTFARTAHLRVDGVSGSQAAQVAEEIGGLTPQGGTNLEEAMRLAYETARRHYLAGGVNRVVLMTDGAANLGNVDPTALKENVDTNRKQGIALDCFGIGWEGYNDDLLETLSRNGDGRYAFINTPEEAARDFVGQLAGALNVAASDVKVQVEFNPKRVTTYRQIGYAKHQLKKEEFRDNSVNAAQIGAAESGNALYTVEVNPAGEGPIAIVRVRYRVPGTQDYHEHEWEVPYQGNALGMEQASVAMRLAGTASAFAEWLGGSPFAAEVTPDRLLSYLNGVPEAFGADQRPKKLEWMIRQAKSLTGK